MGFQFNGTQANVTLTGGITNSLNSPSATQTFIEIPVTNTGAAQTAYTVTAGKTFYLCGLTVPGASANFFLQILNEDTDAQEMLVYPSLTSNNATVIGGICPIKSYAATKNVRVAGFNGQKSYLWGYEQ